MPTNDRLESLCIIRLSAIGDVCNAVAAVQAIQRRHPAVKITWIIGQAEYYLLEGLAGVEFIVFNKKGGRAAKQTLKQKLKGRQFDAMLLMQVSMRANLISRYVKTSRRIGFDKARSKELHNLFINERIATLTHPHVLDGFMGFAMYLGAEKADCYPPRWDIPLAGQELAFALKNVVSEKPTLVIAPSASKSERNWLPERYALVADALNQKGWNTILCGGQSEPEKQLAKRILSYIKGDCTNLVGQTSLKQLLALLKEASLVLAPDTGPAHMAVTQGTPVIGLYGHSNPARTGPYLFQNHVVEVYHKHLKAQTGKTAEQLPWGKRVKGEQVMADISVDLVLSRINELLDERP